MEEMSKISIDEMGCPSDMPKQDHDHEGKMHRSSLFKMAKYSVELLDMIQDADDLPEWVESKITKAADYLGVVKHYLEADDAREMGALEESKSERKRQDIEEINQIMMTRMQPTEVQGLLMILQRDYGHTTPLKEISSYDMRTEEIASNLARAATSAMLRAKDPDAVHPTLLEYFFDDENDKIAFLDGIREEILEQLSEGRMRSIYNEGMVYDVFTEVDKNFKIYEAVQDAITEDGEAACPQCLYEILSDASCGCPDLVPEAEYRGRKVTLNKPTRGDVKKFKVYVKDPKTGNIKKVNFGHGGSSAKKKGEKTMKIRKSNPKARKNFRARHNCKNPGPKTKARYWSCRKW